MALHRTVQARAVWKINLEFMQRLTLSFSWVFASSLKCSVRFKYVYSMLREAHYKPLVLKQAV